MRSSVFSRICAPLALLSFLAACGGDEESAPPPSETYDVHSLRDLYDDGSKLDLNDLLGQTAAFATGSLNDALGSSDFAGISIAPTELYALSAEAEQDLTLKNLDTLVTGLAAKFGEKELTTTVNALRRDHLANSDDDVYADSAFRVAGGLHDWGMSSGGFGSGTARVGFDANAELEARIVRAYEREGTALAQAPLAALKAARGFIVPRSVDELKSLRPGETTALRGKGVLGLNLGVGVPVLAADPGSLSYRIVFSVGVRTRLEGTLDVQVVRLGGDQLLVDVGVERASSKGWEVALRDGWGVSGLIEKTVTLAGKTVDLGKVADKAFAKQLNDKLSLVDASVSATERKSRLSVSRVRFDLSKATKDSPVEKAIAQALRADVRLAQALGNRGEPGVEVEFELSRSGVSSTSYAGIDLFGMSFFRKQAESEGSVVVDTPAGAQSILFESLHKDSGWFFSSHGFGRTVLSGLLFDPDAPGVAEGEANLVVQVVEGDDFMERDKLIDHLDGVIRSIGGDAALAAIADPGDRLELYVKNKCASQSATTCGRSALTDPQVVSLRAEGASKLAQAVSGLQEPLRAVVTRAGELRLTAQATFEPAAALVGPPTGVVLDYRIDDASLAALLGKDAKNVADQAIAHLVAANVRRQETGSARTDRVNGLKRDGEKLREGLVAAFDARKEEYATIHELERAKLEGHPELGELGPRAVAVELPLKDGKPDYEKAALRSLTHRRAQVAARLFDDLVGVGGESGDYGEQVAAYALLSLLPRENLDVRLQVLMDLDDSAAQDFSHYRDAGYANLDVYGRGSASSPIDGGIFAIDQLVDVD